MAVAASATSTTWLFLVLFPSVARSAHTRPTYYDDLQKPMQPIRGGPGQSVDAKRFVAIITITIGIAAGLIADDAYQRVTSPVRQPHTTAELISFIGGILTMLRTVQSKAGNVIINGITRSRRRRAMSFDGGESDGYWV